MPLNPVLDRMPVLILNPHSRCNCRCVMCDIWKVTDAREISPAQLDRHSSDIAALGVEWVVFSGGEPLMHSDFFRLCEILRRRKIRLTLLSTGLLLERFAAQITSHLDDVIVSLDGPPETHDRIRRIPNAFAMLKAGVQSLHLREPDFPVSVRCTVQRENCARLVDTVAAARSIGLRTVSFLAADLTSAAFNRPEGWTEAKQAGVALSKRDLMDLESQIESLVASGECGGFVVETPQKLLRILQHYRSRLDSSEISAPVCNAPWVSAVLEPDGLVRPCFFHPPIGRVVEGENSLLDVINGSDAVAFRTRLNMAEDPVCRRCVCSLNWKLATEYRSSHSADW